MSSPQTTHHDSPSATYRGRFAPSPTGPLHFGSLIAATGSYLQARSRRGEWQLRIDDIDPPREIPGASDKILMTLETFGFEWDGPVSYQSRHHERYRAALDVLQKRGLVYPCGCSRKTIAEAQALSGQKQIYPGTCRNGLAAGLSTRMLRINTQGAEVHFTDRVQGDCHYALDNTIGDFVVLRADGLFAYQLATGLDDAEQGISEVVRGYDLLASTPCQIFIQQGLGLHTPAYCHLPIVMNAQGQKLSKQNLAPALNPQQANRELWQALSFLGQQPPAELGHESLHNIWKWAIKNWQVDKVPAVTSARQ